MQIIKKAAMLLLSFLLVFSQVTGAIHVSAQTTSSATQTAKVIDIAAGTNFTVALKEDGTVWTWGQNNVGQLGIQHTNDQLSPKKVPTLENVIAITAGGTMIETANEVVEVGHALALKADGTVWAWGYNGSGQLGDGTTQSQAKPVQVKELSNVMAIASGSTHNLALTADGSVWAWGNNDYGQVGNGTYDHQVKPQKVQALEKVERIFAGVESNSSFAITADGKAYAWGSNWGKLGVASTIGDESVPTVVTAVENIKTIASGATHTLMTTEDGKTFAWGDNFEGRLGIGTTEPQQLPVALQNEVNFQTIQTTNHSLAVTDNNELWGWGDNTYGALGLGVNTKATSPTQVTIPPVQKVVVGSHHSVALTTDGQLYMWGMNTYGQLGLEQVGLYATPQLVDVVEIVVEKLTLNENEIELEEEQSHQITVTASRSNNTTINVTEQATYTSQAPDIAKVSAKGVVQAVKEGSTTIVVRYDGQSTELMVTVEKKISTVDQAIDNAEKRIAKIPSNVNYAHKKLITQAREAVQKALDLGAKQAQIPSFNKLVAAEQTIADITTNIQQVVKEIAALPAVEDITLAHQPLIESIREKVQHLLTLGVPSNEIKNLAVLIEKENKLADLVIVHFALTANAGFDKTVVAGQAATFDGSLSKDEKRIARYDWSFGDGKSAQGKQVSHTYEQPGQYNATLTVSDKNGNTHQHAILVTVKPAEQVVTLDVKVVDEATNAPLQQASVVVEFPDGSSQKVVTDANGFVKLISEPGEYRAFAYKEHYTPAAIDIAFDQKQTTPYEIKLTRNEMVIGDMTSERMTLEEIKAAGIDVDDPANKWVYKFTITLFFNEEQLEQQTVYVNEDGVIPDFGPPYYRHGEYVWIPWAFIPYEGVEPTLTYMVIPGTASWLKEFFEVKLVVENTAQAQFVLQDAKATLTLPAGLTLAPTAEPQQAEIAFGDLAGGQTANASWIIRGDEKGEYFLSALFSGNLQPFNEPVQAKFVTKEPIKVWGDDALQMFVQAQGWAHLGEPYSVRIGLKNISDVPVYQVSVGIKEGIGYRYSGGYQHAQEIEPGETKWFNFTVISEVHGLLDLSKSFVGKTGGNADLKATLNCIKDDCDVENYRPISPIFRKLVSFVSDPVDISTGAYVYERNVVKLSGARDISFDVDYNSLLLNPGTFGSGWSHNYEVALEKVSDDVLYVHWNPNFNNVFNKHSDGVFYPQNQAVYYDKLVQNDDETYTLTRKDQTQYTFNNEGQLITVKDATGKALQLQYEAGLLTKITEPISQKFIELNYNADNLVSSVNDSTGKTATFAYEQGNLTALTAADGQKSSFVYNAQHQVVQAFDGDQIQLLDNVYDEKGRIISQKDALNNETQFTYERDENTGFMTTTVTDRNGNKKVFVHDTLLNPVSIEDEKGNVTTSVYDELGQLVRQTDRNGHTTSYTYDASGNVASVTDPKGQTTTFSYDARGNVTTIQYPNGSQVKNTYNERNQLVKEVDAQGYETIYTYDEKGFIKTINNKENNKSSYSFKDGKLTTITDPEGNVTTYTYNEAGLLTKVANPAGYGNTFTYDAQHRLIEVRDPLDNVKRYKYDSRGNVVSETDFNGNETKYRYNANGKLIAETNAAGETMHYSYDAEDRLIAVTDPLGNKTSFTYDATGNVIAVIDALGNKTSVQLDAEGRVVAQIDPLGHYTQQLTYDANGNVVTKANALGTETAYQYDAINQLVKQTDANGNETAYSYDEAGQLTQVIDALNQATSQSFTALGEKAAQVDPNQNVTNVTFDKAGKMTQLQLTSGRTITFEYNKQDLVAKKTNGRGQVTSYEYDANDRLVKATSPEGNTTYTYDANGNVRSIQDVAGTMSYEYDRLNRLVNYTDVFGNRIRYEYDAVGNLAKMIYPDGKAVHYRYDKTNKLVSVTDWHNNETTYSYNAKGQLIKTVRANGTVEQRSYDQAGQLIQVKDIAMNGKVANMYDYSYNSIGNMTLEQNQAGLTPFMNKGTLSMTYGKDNQLLTFNSQKVTYDKDGNMVEGPLNNGLQRFEYNSNNLLVKAGTTTYKYDATNNRIQATQNGEVTKYVVNPNASISSVLMETDADGNPTAYYVYGLGLISMETADEQTYNFHYDFRGSTTALTDKEGNVVSRYVYGPYGELVAQSGDVKTHFLYNGRDGVITDDNGLYYMRARYYNPTIKRFVNLDPLLGDIANSQSLNRYAYVQGNPVLNIDPYGLAPDILPDYVAISAQAYYGGGAGASLIIDKYGNVYLGTNVGGGLDIGVGLTAGWFINGGGVQDISGFSISASGTIGPASGEFGTTFDGKLYTEVGGGASSPLLPPIGFRYSINWTSGRLGSI